MPTTEDNKNEIKYKISINELKQLQINHWQIIDMSNI
jgi:hypothetical protein